MSELKDVKNEERGDLRDVKNDVLREYLKVLRWTRLVEEGKVRSNELKELFLNPVDVQREEVREVLEKLLHRAYAEGSFRPKANAVLMGIVGGKPLKECVEGASAYLRAQKGEEVPQKWRDAVENVQKGKVNGIMERNIVTGLEYLKLLEGLSLTEEEWAKVRRKMEGVGAADSQKYYQGFFGEALNFYVHRYYQKNPEVDGELEVRFYAPEENRVVGAYLNALKIKPARLSQKELESLQGLTERILQAVGVEGRTLIVPVRGEAGFATWMGGINVIGIDEGLMRRIKKDGGLTYAIVLAHEAVHLREQHSLTDGHSVNQFFQALSGQDEKKAFYVYNSTIENIADSGAVKAVSKVFGLPEEKVLKAFKDYLSELNRSEESKHLYAHREELFKKSQEDDSFQYAPQF